MVHGGILTDAGDVICGCCGGLIPADEIGAGDDCSHILLDVFDTWVELDAEILGDCAELTPEDKAKIVCLPTIH